MPHTVNRFRKLLGRPAITRNTCNRRRPGEEKFQIHSVDKCPIVPITNAQVNSLHHGFREVISPPD